jgi:hypothetical protein
MDLKQLGAGALFFLLVLIAVNKVPALRPVKRLALGS